MSAYRGEQAPGERKNNQTLRSNFLFRVQHVVRFQLRGYSLPCVEEPSSERWNLESGKAEATTVHLGSFQNGGQSRCARQDWSS